MREAGVARGLSELRAWLRCRVPAERASASEEPGPRGCTTDRGRRLGRALARPNTWHLCAVSGVRTERRAMLLGLASARPKLRSGPGSRSSRKPQCRHGASRHRRATVAHGAARSQTLRDVGSRKGSTQPTTASRALRWVLASRVYPTCVIQLPISGKPAIGVSLRSPGTRVQCPIVRAWQRPLGQTNPRCTTATNARRGRQRCCRSPTRPCARFPTAASRSNAWSRAGRRA
jgi:hypothetical protein